MQVKFHEIKVKCLRIGDMKYKIKVQSRALKPGVSGTDSSEVFTDICEVYAGFGDTGKGVNIFDGVNLIGVATCAFYIRYRSGITAEHFVLYQGNYFKILTVEDPKELHRFLVLYCAEKGSSSLEANKA